MVRHIREDRWLAEQFGHPVFRFDAGAGRASEAAAALREHAQGQATATYYGRVPMESVELLRVLCAAGMYVVDVNVTFRIPAKTWAAARPSPAVRVPVQEVAPAHHADVLAIAERCFRYSRFHLDPHVPRIVADRIKREWIASYLAGRRGEALLVALDAGRPAGFLAVLASEIEGVRVRTIDLIGVATMAQRRGIGRALVESFLERYRDACDEFQVGTQVANVASCAFYESIGFSIVRSAYITHMHVGIPAGGGGR